MRYASPQGGVLLSALLFGCGAVLVKLGGPSPLMAGIARCIVTAIVLSSIRPKDLMGPRWNSSAYVAAIASVACNFAFVTAFSYTKAAVAISIAYSSPVVCPLIAWMLNGERPKSHEMGLIALGSIGVFVIAYGANSEGMNQIAGVVAALAASLGYSIYIVAQKRVGVRADVVPIGNGIVGLVGLPIFIIFSTQSHQDLVSATWFIANGIVCALAFLLVTQALPRLSTARVSLLTMAEVPFAIILTALVLGEVPNRIELIGIALILTCLVLDGVRR